MIKNVQRIISIWTLNKNNEYISSNVMKTIAMSARSFFNDMDRRRIYTIATRAFADGNTIADLSHLVTEWLDLLTDDELRQITDTFVGISADCLTAADIKELIA